MNAEELFQKKDTKMLDLNDCKHTDKNCTCSRPELRHLGTENPNQTGNQTASINEPNDNKIEQRKHLAGDKGVDQVDSVGNLSDKFTFSLKNSNKKHLPTYEEIVGMSVGDSQTEYARNQQDMYASFSESMNGPICFGSKRTIYNHSAQTDTHALQDRQASNWEHASNVNNFGVFEPPYKRIHRQEEMDLN
ncbi:hypothetical protein AX774_g3969 [Zancudomyces culisetae]|uniref:Uncharacterized protein n=1 Tax=Zancudomyces culisetae TaxID=1213189 RepID=A0A1R1PNK1_ZANCU|nr:hypothetical protein AX774_g3969 [Zancudomyces culisetae]|eukprot:OMH82545.1 hypothetical protein AX774_g3969 [Zancudomyces culisetae]